MYGLYDDDYFVERAARPKKKRQLETMLQTRTKYEALAALRSQHGFTDCMSVRTWSKNKIAEVLVKLPQSPNGFPRNAPLYSLLEEKFAWCGSKWEVEEGKVVRINPPTVDGLSISLFELLIVPLELVDGYPSSTASK